MRMHALPACSPFAKRYTTAAANGKLAASKLEYIPMPMLVVGVPIEATMAQFHESCHALCTGTGV